MSKECRDIKELHPVVGGLAEKLVSECRKHGLNIIVTETYRTKERQDYLYAQGRTRPGNIVTHARGTDMTSYHQWRLAFDVCQNIKGKEYDREVLKRVGAIGKGLGLEWGGDWKDFPDTPHYQYTEGLTIKDLKAGKMIKSPNTQYLNAIDKMVASKVISSPDRWKNKTYADKDVESLIIKMAGRL